jgi:purine-binding chemotaxis protein CheW
MSESSTARVNSYLTFKLDEELYAANVNHVISILELTRITKIPRTPDYIKGVINLRGAVLPIVDLRVKFGLSATEFTSNTSILVLEVEIDNVMVNLGAIVESVQEVIEMSDSNILPPPSLGSKFQSDFVEGMFRSNDAFILILNIQRIFTEDELTTIGSNILFQEEGQLTENEKEVTK